jgi:hypothetical protein
MPPPMSSFWPAIPVKGLTSGARSGAIWFRARISPETGSMPSRMARQDLIPPSRSISPRSILCLMKNPRLAAFETHYDDDTRVLFRPESDGLLVAAGDLGTLPADGRGDRDCSSHGIGRACAVHRADAERTGRASASWIRRARVLSRCSISPASGHWRQWPGRDQLEPARFRMNIGIEGLPPWGEFDLVGRTIRLGGRASEACSSRPSAVPPPMRARGQASR